MEYAVRLSNDDVLVVVLLLVLSYHLFICHEPWKVQIRDLENLFEPVLHAESRI